MDALSPQFMLLNQSSGNSPQFSSVLSGLYPDSNNNTGYSNFQSYSDQFVLFDSSTSASNIILPYAVWNIVEGTYYQPKTSLIYPMLGVIIEDN